MIVDSLANGKKYYALGPRLEMALRYLEQTDFTAAKCGDVAIDGGDVFVKIREYVDGGRPPGQCSWEGHRKYLDLHYVADGVERFGYADISAMREVSYDAAKDHSTLEGEGAVLTLGRGFFVLTDTNDIHMPCIADRKLPYLKKVVVKIKA